MNVMRWCPVCHIRWDKSQMMCPDHPGVLGIAIVKYEGDRSWSRLH